MSRVVHGSTEEDEPEAVEGSKVEGEQAVSNKSANYIVSKDTAERELVFPSWNRFLSMNWESRRGGGHGSGRHFEIFVNRVLNPVVASERRIGMWWSCSRSTAEYFFDFSSTFCS